MFRLYYSVTSLQEARDLINAAVFMKSGGRTNTAGALEEVRLHVLGLENGDRLGVANQVVLVTDGGSNVNRNRTVFEATLLKVGERSRSLI